MDKTSLQGGNDQVKTVDKPSVSRAMFVADARHQETIERFYRGLSADQLGAIGAVMVDTWRLNIQAIWAGLAANAGPSGWNNSARRRNTRDEGSSRSW